MKSSYQLPNPKDPSKQVTLIPTGKVYTPRTDPEWLTKLIRDARADAALARTKADK